MAGLGRLLFRDNLQQMGVDEWIVGYRRQFPGQISLDVSGVQRTIFDRYALVDINGFYPDGPGQPFGGFGRIDPNLGQILQIVNWDGNRIHYRALDVTVAKEMTHGFQALMAFHHQWQHMSGVYAPTDPVRFIQPDSFPNNRTLPRTRTAEASSYPGSGSTNSMWSPYSFRVAGTWQAPADVVLSGSFTVLATPWTGPIVDQLAANDPDLLRFGPATVVSSTGVRQSNPLATRIRFVYPTRSEGQIPGPVVKTVSMKAAKRVRLGANRNVEAALNILNLLNSSGAQLWTTGSNARNNRNFNVTAGPQPSRAYQLDVMFRF